MKAKQQEIKLPTPQRRYNTQNAANRSINSMYQQQIADRSINNRSQYNTIIMQQVIYHRRSQIPGSTQSSGSTQIPGSTQMKSQQILQQRSPQLQESSTLKSRVRARTYHSWLSFNLHKTMYRLLITQCEGRHTKKKRFKTRL